MTCFGSQRQSGLELKVELAALTFLASIALASLFLEGDDLGSTILLGDFRDNGHGIVSARSNLVSERMQRSGCCKASYAASYRLLKATHSSSGWPTSEKLGPAASST